MKVAAIDYRRNVQVLVDQPSPPGSLRVVIGHSPCNVMNNSYSDVPVRGLRGAQDIESGACPSLADFEAEPISLLAGFPESHRSEHFNRALVSLLAQGDGIKASDGVLCRDRGVFPRPICAGRLGMRYQLQFQAMRIPER